MQDLHKHHGHHHGHGGSAPPSLNRLAFSATAHGLTGCAIGEMVGLVIGAALGWGTGATMALAVLLAFFFGYLPPLRSGIALGTAVGLALASDTASIAIMEALDNAIRLPIPGAMEAPLSTLVFQGSLAVALLIAATLAFQVSRRLIQRNRGHALVHMLSE